MLMSEKVTACIRELARWCTKCEVFYPEEMDLIMMKHFPSAGDRSEFNAFIFSSEGMGRLKKQLRLEAWQSVLGGEEKSFWFSTDLSALMAIYLL